ncbi:hypothetical protein IPA_08615 [Ignicoccus pacificus DSM 13166]|uniref:Thioredoxin domain-containing protein n=1 Tax=Ignicoccus pacificus DSM 13166 TaxID=940294 RepID=A0A977KBZ9_9CREN|nr:hypothetical protein IPA_08615 [Ignicoccus pacificus DSM 13166]
MVGPGFLNVSFRTSRKGKGSRLDFKRKESSKIGIYMLIVVIAGLFIASFFINYEENVAKTYVLSKGFSITNVASFDKILKENKYVAVMFKSSTCPVCKRMYPYWVVLEGMPGKVKFYDITYSPSTADVFQRYGVEDVPTFIVFKNGKEVARHVGGFVGSNITSEMRNWVYASLGLSSQGPDYWYSVYTSSCAKCHGAPMALTKEAIQQWLSSSQAQNIAPLIEKAVANGELLSQYLGGFNKLEQKVATMKKYTSLNQEQIKASARFLDYVSAILLNQGEKYAKQFAAPPKVNVENGAASKVETEGTVNYAGVVAFLVGLAAGLAAAVSPCVLPLFITHITSSIRRNESSLGSSISCAVLAALGVAALGALFLIFSDVVLSVQKMILPVVGAAVLAAGLASVLNVPMEVSTAKLNKRSTSLFCALYGFLSVQCNLPLVIGALLLIATAGGLSTLVGFALGIGIPLAVVSYLAPKAKNLAMVLTNKSKEIELISAILMIIAGVYLLLYSFGVVV